MLADRGWRVVSFDLRGHGESAWDPEGDYTLDAFAADITLVARSFDRRPALVGASLGGITSMVAIADAGGGTEVASSLTLVDVAHRSRSRPRPDRRVHDRRSRRFRLARGGGRCRRRLQPASTASQGPRPAWRRTCASARTAGGSGTGTEVHHGQVRLAGRDPLVGGRSRPAQAAATSLTLPTLLVRGRSSDLLSEAGAQAFLDVVPHADFADVDGAGHMVAGDRNEVFNKAILEFLADHRPD